MTVSDPTPAKKRFSDRQWRNLLTDIHDGQVVAVVGSELAIDHGEPQEPTLYQQVAKELAQRLGLDETLLPPTYGLLAVSNLFLQNPSNEVDDLYREARAVFGCTCTGRLRSRCSSSLESPTSTCSLAPRSTHHSSGL